MPISSTKRHYGYGAVRQTTASTRQGHTEGGYTVSVGRIREDDSGIFDIKFVALSHNSKGPPLLLSSVTNVIGAAGSSILKQKQQY
jgi:aspartate-semialdehyde dehydrogenase